MGALVKLLYQILSHARGGTCFFWQVMAIRKGSIKEKIIPFLKRPSLCGASSGLHLMSFKDLKRCGKPYSSSPSFSRSSRVKAAISAEAARLVMACQKQYVPIPRV